MLKYFSFITLYLKLKLADISGLSKSGLSLFWKDYTKILINQKKLFLVALSFLFENF